MTRVVSATPLPVARSAPAIDAPVSRRIPARNRNSARMWLPTSPARRAAPACSASPSAPPRSWKCAGSHVWTRAGAVPEPERARGVRERQRREQADRRRAERAHGRQHGPHARAPRRRRQAERDDVGDAPEEPQQAVDERGAAGARVPAEVEREREEDAGREQAQARSGRNGAARAPGGAQRHDGGRRARLRSACAGALRRRVWLSGTWAWRIFATAPFALLRRSPALQPAFSSSALASRA